MLPSFLSPLHREPVSIERGEGSHVFDTEGRRYLDFFGGILTTMVGHGRPEVVEAIRAQAGRVLHTSTLYLSEPMIAFAEEVAAVSGIPDARVFFTTSGTEANDTALLLATLHRRSNQVLAVRNSYHGRSLTAQAVTSHRSWKATAASRLETSQGAVQHAAPLRQSVGLSDKFGGRAGNGVGGRE